MGQPLNKVQKDIYAEDLADEIMQDRNGIKLIGVNNDVRAILEMTGFYDTLDIE
jgi:hypothetical protein